MWHLPLTLALAVAPAHAGFPGERWNESVVVGASVALALGEVEGSRLGVGFDLGYQLQ